jgi:hypothetical protein
MSGSRTTTAVLLPPRTPDVHNAAPAPGKILQSPWCGYAPWAANRVMGPLPVMSCHWLMQLNNAILIHGVPVRFTETIATTEFQQKYAAYFNSLPCTGTGHGSQSDTSVLELDGRICDFPYRARL